MKLNKTKSNNFVTFVVFCASISIALIPVQRMELPFNVSIVDIWNFFALPIIFIYLLLNRKKIQTPYATAMWMIIVGSLIGTFSAKDPLVSSVIIIKELYIYIWFLLFTALFSNLDTYLVRRILKTWVYIAIAHSFILIAQFLSDEFLAYSTAHISDAARPIGLLKNPNLAAIYQAMSIIPLLILQYSRKKTSILLAILFISVVATGSMGATLAILLGMMFFYFQLSRKRKNTIKILKKLFLLLIPIILILIVLSLFDIFDFRINERIDELMFSRAERSANTRFYLWEQIGNLHWTAFLVGVGPNQFINGVFNVPLHNDLLAFIVERGVIGFIGILMFFTTAMYRPYRFIRKNSLKNSWLIPILASQAAIVSIILESMTHQVFHFRSIWMILAVQEAILLYGKRENKAKFS